MTEMSGARAELATADGSVGIHRLRWLTEQGIGGDIGRLPHTVRILLENLLRRAGTRDVCEDDVAALARGRTAPAASPERRVHAATAS